MARKPRTSSSRRSRSAESSVTSLRIIGGKLRGQTIRYSGDTRTRPMKERVREAIFNLIGPAIKQRLVLDLFAGTGAIALEALSRGASQALLLEQHFPTVRLVGENAASLGLAEQVEVIGTDTFFWVKHRLPHQETLASDTPWVIFCSPPYIFYTQRWPEMEQLIHSIARLAPPQSLFVLESDQNLDLAQLPWADQWDVRTYAPSVVGILTLEENLAVDDS